MTFPASLLSPKFSRNVAAVLVALLFPACTHTQDTESRNHRPDTSSSRFEWAVQHYEAGNYEKAIRSFESLRKEGPALADYDLLAFYLGMSHFRLGQYDKAAQELESFVRGASAGAVRQEDQDARIALLLSYEKLSRWQDAASLAMETDKLTLFQNNRALLKLVWARALREQGELLGAKTALDETQPFLDKVGGDETGTIFYADPDQDLWGRFHYTSILVQEAECTALHPKELASAKPQKGKKARKKATPPRRLYPAWLEAAADCQRQAVEEAADNLFERESPWGAPALASISQGIDTFGAQIQSYLKDEAPALERHRALLKSARENLYRLMGAVETKLKLFKDRDLTPDPLELLRKKIDSLLERISSP